MLIITDRFEYPHAQEKLSEHFAIKGTNKKEREHSTGAVGSK